MSQTPPRTPPRAALEKPLPPSPNVEVEDDPRPRFDAGEQQQREPEAEAEPITPPQVQARNLEPTTPTGSQGPAQESLREPTLSPGTMLDPLTPPSQRKHQPDSESSTPPWHQYSSSLSPPSIPTTSSKTRPSNATPRFKRPQHDSTDAMPASGMQSYDLSEQGNWNDTPPEWASPSGSDSNTPTRNRSLRTRNATARALALQDQLTSPARPSKTAHRGSEEYYRTPNITVPARGHSLRIQAGPQARAHGTPPEQQNQKHPTNDRTRETGNLAYATLPSQKPQNTASGSHKPTSSTDNAQVPKYKYPAVPRSGAVATGIPSQARAQTHSSSGHSRNSSRPQSKDGKHTSIVKKPEKGGAFNYTQMLLQEPGLDLDGEGESPPEYADASRAPAQARNYTQEQHRQLAEMERDAIDMQREAMARRAALSTSDPGSSRQSSETGASTAAIRAGPSAHMQVTQPPPEDLGLDSPTLPTNTRTSRDSPKNREMPMPPVTKVFSTDTGSGSDTSRARKQSRRSSKESNSNPNSNSNTRKSSRTRRESMSLIAKAQKYMRDAGYGSWGQGQSGSDRDGEGQSQTERSFEPPAGRGPLPGDRKKEAGDTRALGVSGFIPAAEPRVHDFDRQEREALSGFMRAPSGDARATSTLTGVAAEQHDRELVSGQHEYEQDSSSFEQGTPTYTQATGGYDHETSRYDQETPRYEQDNSSGRYELDTTPIRETRAEEYSDEHEALLGNRESQASFVSSNRDWRNTAGYATNMI